MNLSEFIPHFVKKLGDSKNIIRQEAIMALVSIFWIKRAEKEQREFMREVTPYLRSSQNWHIREELLNVIMHCFLQAKSVKEYDSQKLLLAILQLLTDQKDKVRNVAIETFVVFCTLRGFAAIQ